MPLKTSFFPSLTDESICQPNRVSIKTLHVKLFFDKKTCVCQKLSWGGGGGVVGKYSTPEPCKIILVDAPCLGPTRLENAPQ